jgi:transcriptional regulator with XRE-family HTH domain
MDSWTTNARTFRTFLLVSQIDPGAIQSRIRQARKEAGLTQQELADLIERHKRTIENYERVRVPDWSELAKIARVLDRPVEWFLHGDRNDDEGDLAALLQEVRDEIAAAVAAVDRKLDQLDLAARLNGIERELTRLRQAVAASPGR